LTGVETSAGMTPSGREERLVFSERTEDIETDSGVIDSGSVKRLSLTEGKEANAGIGTSEIERFRTYREGRRYRRGHWNSRKRRKINVCKKDRHGRM